MSARILVTWSGYELRIAGLAAAEVKPPDVHDERVLWKGWDGFLGMVDRGVCFDVQYGFA